MNWQFLFPAITASSIARAPTTVGADPGGNFRALATSSSAPPRPIDVGANSTPTELARKFKGPMLPVERRPYPAGKLAVVEPWRRLGKGTPGKYSPMRLVSSIRSEPQLPCVSPETTMLLRTRVLAGLLPRRYWNHAARSSV